MTTQQGQFAPVKRPMLLGVRSTLPLLPGSIPFGLIYGATALSAHMPAWLAQAMSFIVFAGSAQFAIVLLVSGGASALVLVLTGATINLRHMLYSASLGPMLRDAPRGWRLLLSYLLVDEVYGVVVGKLLSLPKRQRVWFMFGSGATLWVNWQAATFAGVMIGARIPASWSLDFAATLTFLALLVPMLRDRALVAAAAAAGIAAALSVGAPLKLGLVLAAVAGVAVGVLVDRRTPPRATATTPGAPDAESVSTVEEG